MGIVIKNIKLYYINILKIHLFEDIKKVYKRHFLRVVESSCLDYYLWKSK